MHARPLEGTTFSSEWNRWRVVELERVWVPFLVALVWLSQFPIVGIGLDAFPLSFTANL